MTALPIDFVKTFQNVHKEKGKAWVDNFENFIEECEQRWGLVIQPPFDLSYNFVAPAIDKDGQRIVIKLTVPNEEFDYEIEALKWFNRHGNCMVNFLEADPGRGVLLMQQLIPGTTLAELENDEEATMIAARVMEKLWVPAPGTTNMPTMADREKSLKEIYEKNHDGIGLITKEVLKDAVKVFKRMNHEKTERYMLHGDLHHYNILLSGEDSWFTIDPKGLIGEREYDVIQFLLNRLSNENIEAIIEKRIDILVERLNLDKKRILSWGFAHAVLSTCWSLEEGGAFCEPFFKSIQVFKKLHFKQYGSL